MKEIKSPKSDVAKKQVLIVEKANILIKEKIVEAFKIGKSKDQLSKELEQLIEDLGKELKEYPEVYELYIRGMRASTQRWYMLYSENIKTITNMAVANLSKVGIPVKDISVTFSSQEKFRPYVSNNPKGLAIIDDYQRKVKQTLGMLIHDNPTSTITDKNGVVKRVSLRNQTETLVRIEANGKDVESMRASGVKLVVTTTHADCSKRCEKWQGRIFSLDGTSGVIDGKRYIPIEDAMRGVNGDGNGIISGYNCRHRAIPYESGMVMPKEYTSAEIRQARAIDSEQRYRERTIRGLKVQERLLRKQDMTIEAHKTRESWRKKQEEYKIFSLENNRSYELWRCRISDDEKDEIIDTEMEIIDNQNKEILNKYTNNGNIKLTTKGGINIGDIGYHFKYRQNGRDVTLDDALDALVNPLKYGKERINERGEKSIQYIGERATAYINPDTGKLTTTHKTHRKLVNKLKGGNKDA